MPAFPASALGQPTAADAREGRRPVTGRAAAPGDDPLVERAWSA
ncbi:1,2-phenylacetyl-CoA epoxidase subunit PaaD, partial [Burkholderia pseudomallei]